MPKYAIWLTFVPQVKGPVLGYTFTDSRGEFMSYGGTRANIGMSGFLREGTGDGNNGWVWLGKYEQAMKEVTDLLMDAPMLASANLVKMPGMEAN